MKFLRLLSFLAGLLFPVAAFAQYNPNTVVAIPNVATLQAQNYTNYGYVQLLGYHTPGDLGNGFLQKVNSCTVDNGVCFQDAAGNHFQRLLGSTGISVDMYGAYGDAVLSTNGVANGTTTFTGSNCTTYFSAGQTRIIITPPPGTANAQVNTSFTCNSSTSFHLASAPSWSASNVRYWVGHDDSTALSNALSAAAAKYGSVTLGKLASYLVTSLPNGLGNVGVSIIGQPTGALNGTGTQTAIVFGGLSSGQDGLTLSSFGTPKLIDIAFLCEYGGQDCLNLGSLPGGAILKNVFVGFANRDCIEATGGVESVSANTIVEQNCGRDGFNNSASYFNTSILNNLNFRGISTRQAGGYGIITGGSQDEGNSFSTVELDAEYGPSGVQSTYAPANNAIDFGGSGSFANTITSATVENTGGTSICSPCSAVIGSGILESSVTANSNWSANGCQGPGFCGVLAANSNAALNLFSSPAYGSLFTTLSATLNANSTESICTYLVSMDLTGGSLGGNACVAPSLGFTVTFTNSSGVTTAVFTNTSAYNGVVYWAGLGLTGGATQ